MVRELCGNVARVEWCSMSAEGEALLQVLGAHRQPHWQPARVT